MERKIGEIFEYNGEWYQCVEGKSCNRCAFKDTKCGDISNIKGYCSLRNRSDKKSVIFKKLEKVGEPYEYFMQGTGIILVQEYILASQSYICGDEVIDCQKDGRVAIEIKQTKEDMEEKDIKPYDKNFSEGTVSNTENLVTSSLKPFDLEASKAGKPVCTRDGRKARIICFDKKDSKPIVALIQPQIGNDIEVVMEYHKNGRVRFLDKEDENDLMMLSEKKEGWIIKPKDYQVYQNKEDAERVYNKDYQVIAKVCWEE